MAPLAWETATLQSMGCNILDRNPNGVYRISRDGVKSDVNIDINGDTSPEHQIILFLLNNGSNDDDTAKTKRIRSLHIITTMDANTIQAYLDSRMLTALASLERETKKFDDHGERWMSCLPSGIYMNSVLFDFIDSLGILDNDWYTKITHDYWYPIRDAKPNRLSKEQIAALQYLHDDFDIHDRLDVIKDIIQDHRGATRLFLIMGRIDGESRKKLVHLYHENHDISVLNIDRMTSELDIEFLTYQWSLYEKLGFDPDAYLDYILHHNAMAARRIDIDIIDCMIHARVKNYRGMAIEGLFSTCVHTDYHEINEDTYEGIHILHNAFINGLGNADTRYFIRKFMSTICQSFYKTNMSPYESGSMIRLLAKSMLDARDKHIPAERMVSMMMDMDGYRTIYPYDPADVLCRFITQYAQWMGSKYYDAPYEFFHEVSMMERMDTKKASHGR